MIAGLLLAQILAGLAPPSPAPVPQLSAAAVLQRYAAALAKVREPRVLTFDYTLEQTGMRTLTQTHRVFRSDGNERDETLIFDGRPLTRPKVRIFRGRRNRYTITALAPRPADYRFAFVGPQKNAHHFDYVFRLTPKAVRRFRVTGVTIDGVRFLPSAISFETGPSDGRGSITFGRNAAWWVAYSAAASATVADITASERLSFYTYRFPSTLPPSTFGQARPYRKPAPDTLPLTAPGAVTPPVLRRIFPQHARLPG